MPKKADPTLPRGISFDSKTGCYVLTWHDQHGKKHRERISKSLKATLKVQVKRKENSRLGKKLEPLNRKSLTLADLVDKYEPEILSKNSKSAAEYTRQGKLWKDVMGSDPVEDIQAGQVEAWKAKRLKTHKPATVNLSLRYLKMLFNLAIRDEVLDKNPLAAGRVKEIRENNAREKILEPAEEAKLEGVLPRWLWVALQIALQTGLRSSELFEQKKAHVDLARRLYTIGDAKGGGRQVIKLNSLAVEYLREAMDSPTEWLYPNRMGTGPRDATSVTKLLQRHCDALGIKDVTWHCARHTMISRLCMLAVPLPTVQRLARHKSITMTLRYAHLCPDHQVESLELLATFGK